jgi:AraC-like DNA-binding protein
MDQLQNIEKVYHGLDVTNPFQISLAYIPHKRNFYSGDIHYDMQMIITLSGREDVAFSGFKASFLAGQIWWTSPWEPHAGRIASDHFGVMAITISPEFLGSIDPFQNVDWLLPFVLPPARRPTPRTRAERLSVLLKAREIIQLERHKPYGWRTLQWFKIHEIIIRMIQLIPDSEIKSWAGGKMSLFARIMPAIQMVKKNPLQSLSLDNAAKACGLGRSSFCSAFKQVMGIGFGRFALRARINQAAQMLCSEQASIKDVAFACDFKDLGHFYHVFSRFFNCTPSEFIKGGHSICNPAITNENEP